MAKTIEERYLAYTSERDATQLKVTACFCKASGKSVVLFYTSEAMASLVKARSNALVYKDEGIRWKGPMVNKLDMHVEAFRLTLNVAWNKFQVGSNGFMSDAQEQAILAALTEGGEWFPVKDPELMRLLRSLTWEWRGHNHRRGVHDLYARLPDGREVWVEVKGVNGRLYYS